MRLIQPNPGKGPAEHAAAEPPGLPSSEHCLAPNNAAQQAASSTASHKPAAHLSDSPAEAAAIQEGNKTQHAAAQATAHLADAPVGGSQTIQNEPLPAQPQAPLSAAADCVAKASAQPADCPPGSRSIQPPAAKRLRTDPQGRADADFSSLQHASGTFQPSKAQPEGLDNALEAGSAEARGWPFHHGSGRYQLSEAQLGGLENAHQTGSPEAKRLPAWHGSGRFPPSEAQPGVVEDANAEADVPAGRDELSDTVGCICCDARGNCAIVSRVIDLSLQLLSCM